MKCMHRSIIIRSNAYDSLQTDAVEFVYTSFKSLISSEPRLVVVSVVNLMLFTIHLKKTKTEILAVSLISFL